MGAQPFRFALHHDPVSPSAPTPRRSDSIQERLESGFYRKPDILLETAARLLTDLMDGSPLDDLVGAEPTDQRER